MKVAGEGAARSVAHGTFTIERELPYPPAQDFRVGGKKLSVSLATIEFEPSGKGTKLLLTEQGAYVDGGIDGNAGREHGTRAILEGLVKYLQG